MTFKATTASEVVLELAYLLLSNAAVLSRANPTPLGADKLMNEMARVADRIERTKEGESVQLSS